MHVELLNLGFVYKDGTYTHGELGLVVKIVDNDIIAIVDGADIPTSIDRIEEALLNEY